MKYLSVCSGIEAASVAWHPLGWEAVGYSEIEPFPSAVLAHHYPSVKNYGDMTKFKEWGIGKFDILVGGTPCQSFSVAGLRKGLSDPRGNLMLTFGAIADYYKPAWIVWENVPGVLSSNRGRDFGSFIGMLGQLGYGVAYRVLDAQYFGVPQRRRRVFVVGYLGDWRRAAAVLFESESMQGNPAPSREKGKDVTEIAGTLTSNGGGTSRPAGNCNELDFCIVAHGQANVEIRTDGGAPALTCNHEAPIISYGIPGNWIGRKPENGGNAVEPMHNIAPCLTKTDKHGVAFSFDALASNSMKSSNPISGCNQVDVAKTIDTSTQDPSKNQGGICVLQSSVRRLTPMEAERLQGFPDDWTLIPWRGKPAPDGPRYKACGNSMAVPVMRWIGERIKKYAVLQD